VLEGLLGGADFAEFTFHALGGMDLSRARRGEALGRKSSPLYLQMEPLFAPVSLWG
jgi:hypothetical protein